MVPCYSLLMLMVSGIPVTPLYRDILSLHLGTQSSPVAITRGSLCGMVTTILFPSLGRRFLPAAGSARAAVAIVL